MSNPRTLLKDCLPPILLRTLRPFRRGGVRFEGEYSLWDEAASLCSGYVAPNILEQVLAAACKVQRGEAAFERDAVTFDEPEYVWPVLTGLMWSAARNGGRLHVLDFGGSLGSTYFQHRKFLKKIGEVHWSIVEQPHYVRAGQEHIRSEHLEFFPSITAALSSHPANTILLSSSLQYLPNPLDILEQLSGCGATCLILDRTPFSTRTQDIITIQKVPDTIYPASYPMRIFALPPFLREMENRFKWSPIASHDCIEGRMQTDRKSDFFYKGMIWESIR